MKRIKRRKSFALFKALMVVAVILAATMAGPFAYAHPSTENTVTLNMDGTLVYKGDYDDFFKPK